MTFQNNYLDGAWNKGTGGNGYFRNSKLYYSLIKNNTIRNLRHLAIQWSATGNLIEENNLDCDLNLHGGWERNNIFRNNYSKISFEHRHWNESAGIPSETETWFPVWWAASPHAGDWSGPSGFNNIFYNNTLIKQKTKDGPFENWGLYDTPNMKYTFCGTSDDTWEHLKKDGEIIKTWYPDVCYYQSPNSGVTVTPLTDKKD